jgi:hypothetical protein
MMSVCSNLIAWQCSLNTGAEFVCARTIVCRHTRQACCQACWCGSSSGGSDHWGAAPCHQPEHPTVHGAAHAAPARVAARPAARGRSGVCSIASHPYALVLTGRVGSARAGSAAAGAGARPAPAVGGLVRTIPPKNHEGTRRGTAGWCALSTLARSPLW